MVSIKTARRFAAHFVSDERILTVEAFGDGLINATFLVATDLDALPKFILQRVNREVFPRAEWVMDNLLTLDQHIHPRRRGNKVPALRLPVIHNTLDGQCYFTDSEESIWRALEYVENTLTLERIRDSKDAEQVGFALGAFHSMISDLDPNLLRVTLPGFHNAPGYLADYRWVLAGWSSAEGSAEELAWTEFIDARAGQVGVLEDAKNRGLLRIRPIHGDPKLDNVLFDESTGRAVSMIDLDTVMPGLIHYDIGDCLRSCCNKSGEAPASAEMVDFDLDVCRFILGAYFEEAGDFLTTQDYAFVYDAIRLLPFELGLRFFTDYLEGNKYFKNLSPEETLHRAKTQFELTKRIEQKEDQIRCLIAELVMV